MNLPRHRLMNPPRHRLMNPRYCPEVPQRLKSFLLPLATSSTSCDRRKQQHRGRRRQRPPTRVL
ncbi:hypothetical protein E2C01_033741 [Portunus trituberculatus]|uniref:Uncharacterized protein n=1 Tax=Portunus trituberculatus TaxID=210409 RepID=A0A5B7F3H7_PORTR|nr:hypothetical protein [Portunus trituberculatus]